MMTMRRTAAEIGALRSQPEGPWDLTISWFMVLCGVCRGVGLCGCTGYGGCIPGAAAAVAG
jgi:hypothetical protein